MPSVKVQEPSFTFSPTFVGGAARLPLTLANEATVPATLVCDLTAHPDFELMLSSEDGAWGSQMLCTNDLWQHVLKRLHCMSAAVRGASTPCHSHCLLQEMPGRPPATRAALSRGLGPTGR